VSVFEALNNLIIAVIVVQMASFHAFEEFCWIHVVHFICVKLDGTKIVLERLF